MSIRRRVHAPPTFTLATLAAALFLTAADAPARTDFSRDVAPLIAARCAECHHPADDKGGLDLTTRDGWTRGGDGGALIDAIAPEKSEILWRISLPAGDPDVMPAKGETLAPAEIELIRAWISEGADFGDWSAMDYTPPAEGRAAEVAFPAREALPSRKLTFNRDIRPILSNHCFQCHGPDAAAREAGLRLDLREEALAARNGLRAIVAGDHTASESVRRIFHPDPAERMPPPESEKPLSDADRLTLAAWIAQGAEYEPHWAWIPPVRPPVPAASPATNPVDAFINRKLAAAGVKPSERARPADLVRRVSFDLTGLPPAPGLADRYAADPSDETWRALVRELLASPAHGERMAADWLDQVRYADTNGYHSDNPRNVWRYRDYVIDAFNDNLPYDRFTIEQVAGDLLPDADRNTLIASGFNRLNQITEEGGAQAKEYLAKYMADRVRAVGSVWMGVTVGCAECHDHKFDPFTTKEFYSLGAFFADLDEAGVATSANNFAPFVYLPDEKQGDELMMLDMLIGKHERTMNSYGTELAVAQFFREEWLAANRDAAGDDWMPCRPESFTSRDGQTLELLDDLSILASGPIPDQEVYEILIRTDRANLTGLQLEAMSHHSFYRGVVRDQLSYWLNEIEVEVAPAKDGEFKRVDLATAKANDGIAPAKEAIDGDALTAWWGASRVKGAPSIIGAFGFASPVPAGPGTWLKVRLRHLGGAMYSRSMFGRIRLSLTTAGEIKPGKEPGTPEFVLAALAPGAEPDKETREDIREWFRMTSAEYADTRNRLDDARKQRNKLEREMDWTLVSRRRAEPRTIRVLPRGNWLDETGPVVTPALPEFPGAILAGAGSEGAADDRLDRLDRLDLANWLVSAHNPLTARVEVNRLWNLFFGRGLSGVLDDLGSQGEWPTHPDLLDWLAVEFIESGWDVRHIIRLIVTSDAYRRSSSVRDDLAVIDPDNRLYARLNARRLTAEMIRDNALRVSGLLVPTIGGPSVMPYQPDGYWDNLNFPPRIYREDKGEAQYRRGLYVHWQRSFLHPSMLAFDAPSREECTAKRPVSSTPLQSLVLLNDPTYVEAARMFAVRLIRDGGDTTEDRVRWAVREALSREATPREVEVLAGLYRSHRVRIGMNPESAAELLGVGQAAVPVDLDAGDIAAWTSVTRAIMNLHEFVTRA